MSENPYQAPAAPVADLDESHSQLDLASRNRRLANYLLDLIVFYFLSMIVGAVLGFAGLGDWLNEMNRFAQMLFSYVLYIAYYLVFEGSSSRSPAKYITRTKVVTADGAVPTFAHIVKRTLARIIPFEPFSFLMKGESGGWHDSLSDTRVVVLPRR